MRVGTGRIHFKTPNKHHQSSLTQITNQVHSKSQASTDKCEKQTYFQSLQSKTNSKTSNKGQNQSIFTDPGLVQQDQEVEDHTSIVRKLTSLNNIFKELKLIKQSEVPFHVLRALSKVEDKFIAVQREILKSTHILDKNS